MWEKFVASENRHTVSDKPRKTGFLSLQVRFNNMDFNRSPSITPSLPSRNKAIFWPYRCTWMICWWSGNNSCPCAGFNAHLNRSFRIKDLGPLKYLLGIEASQISSSLFFNQHKCTLDTFSECDMLCSRLSYFSMERQCDSNSLFVDP